MKQSLSEPDGNVYIYKKVRDLKGSPTFALKYIAT